MMMTILRRAAKIGSTALVVAGVLGMATLANAGNKNSAPASRPAPAPRVSQPASRPSSRPAQPSFKPQQQQRPSQQFGKPGGTPGAFGGAGHQASPQGVHSFTPGHSSTPEHSFTPRQPVARGMTVHNAPNGNSVRMRANGRPSEIHDARRGMDVHHGLNGNRRVMVEGHDHSRTFYQRGRPGYVQHPYNFHGHEFGQRAYFFHGHEYNRHFMGYPYRGGVYLSVYAPGAFYSPYFYGWAYNPWASPVAFGWGFAGSPWYGYYGYYFTPYDSYPSASYWLTDYMISSDLQADYEAHAEAGEQDGAAPAAPGPPMLTPEVKQQIADEVRNELALENQEAGQVSHQQDVEPGSSSIDRLFSDAAHGKRHIFVVGASLDVVDNTQTECSLSDGDVLALQVAPPTDAVAADLVVLASKGGNECQKQATVSVALADLQEMQNHMRASIDQGLQELQAKQGKNGLPALPSAAQAQPVPAPYAAIAPPPDPNAVAAEIQQQAQQADQAEKEITADAAQPGSN